MHAVLLTLIALGAGGDAYASGRITQSSADIYNASSTVNSGVATTSATTGGDYGGGCDTCGDGSCGHAGRHGKKTHMGGWFGDMPQTCYEPRYGCYYGGGRHMHRYPAFHGTFARRAYNYRNYFDYPWHAEMHEPTSHFSYNVIGEENVPPPAPEQVGTPPVPEPEFEARAKPRAVGTGVHRDLTDPRVTPATTLRR